MLEHLGFLEEASVIYNAVDVVVQEGRENREWLTPDMGGSGNTEDIVQEVVKRMR